MWERPAASASLAQPADHGEYGLAALVAHAHQVNAVFLEAVHEPQSGAPKVD